MEFLSTHLHSILVLLPSNSSINNTKVLPFSLKPLRNLETKKHLSLNLSKPTSLAPLRATYDIPIDITDKEHEKFLDSEPWKGSVVYKRDASVTHVEFSTSLGDLALGWVSSPVSANRAALMGLKLPPEVDDDDDEEEEEEEVEGEEEEEEEKEELGLGDLFGDDVIIEGKDENGNPIFISGEELRNAEVKVEYANQAGDPLGFDDDDDDDDWVDTPVFVSVDVTRRKGRIRLDGIIRTVITLDCNRCYEPAAECVYLNFSLLLSEEPIEEPPADYFDSIEEVFEDNNASKFSWEDNGLDGDEDKDISWEDRLYFPRESKEIDISKHIRDFIHLKINSNGLCSLSCKGMCLQCENNLNWSKCTCKKVEGGEKEERYGPLRDSIKKIGRTV